MTQTMTLMVHPSALLNSNDRTHWRNKAAKTQWLRFIAANHARKYLNTVTTRQHITVTFGFLTNRKRDVANWYPTVKACVDGLQDAQILPGDDGSWVIGPDHRVGALSTDCHTQPVRKLRRVEIHILMEDA